MPHVDRRRQPRIIKQYVRRSCPNSRNLRGRRSDDVVWINGPRREERGEPTKSHARRVHTNPHSGSGTDDATLAATINGASGTTASTRGQAIAHKRKPQQRSPSLFLSVPCSVDGSPRCVWCKKDFLRMEMGNKFKTGSEMVVSSFRILPHRESTKKRRRVAP